MICVPMFLARHHTGSLKYRFRLTRYMAQAGPIFDLSLPRMRYLRRLSKTLTVLGIAHATAFGFEPNDGVVGQSSQWGLLSGAHSSQFNFSDGIHLLNTSSTGISQRVVELLNAPADAGGLFAGGGQKLCQAIPVIRRPISPPLQEDFCYV